MSKLIQILNKIKFKSQKKFKRKLIHFFTKNENIKGKMQF